MSVDIVKYTGTTNTNYYPKSRSIKYIVLHYTAGTRSTKGAARNVASMFKAGSVGGSADFIVDDAEIVQYNGDIAHRACWSVGGNKWKTKSTTEAAKFYNECGNHNSISIEMCSNKANKKSLGAYDRDWYLTDATINNAVKITKYLMQQYNIPVDRVIMHHQVTGKICPNPWCVNEGRLSGWYDFKRKITANKEVDDELVETGTITVNGKNIKIDKIVKDGVTFIKLRGLENAGFEVGYDVDSKNLILNNKINNLPVIAGGVEHKLPAINIEGYNYFSARSFAELIGFDIEYENKSGKVVLK